MEIDMNGSIQLTIEQRFQIEQFNRTLKRQPTLNSCVN